MSSSAVVIGTLKVNFVAEIHMIDLDNLGQSKL